MDIVIGLPQFCLFVFIGWDFVSHLERGAFGLEKEITHFFGNWGLLLVLLIWGGFFS